jgi:hypothetical protein
MDYLRFGYTILIFTLIILYLFAFPEFLIIVKKLVGEKERKNLYELGGFFFLLSFMLLEAGRVVREEGYPEAFIISLGLFFTSLAIFTVGIVAWETWKARLAEHNIKLLLSRFSMWIVQLLFALTVAFCFILSIVILVKFLLTFT